MKDAQRSGQDEEPGGGDHELCEYYIESAMCRMDNAMKGISEGGMGLQMQGLINDLIQAYHVMYKAARRTESYGGRIFEALQNLVIAICMNTKLIADDDDEQKLRLEQFQRCIDCAVDADILVFDGTLRDLKKGKPAKPPSCGVNGSAT